MWAIGENSQKFNLSEHKEKGFNDNLNYIKTR